jgi:hypothetical protein
MTVVVDGRTLVRFIVKIDDRPSWLETSMLNRLEKKLREELGSPAPAPSRKPPPKDAPKDAPREAPKDPPKDPPADGPRLDEGGPPISPTP